MPALKEFADFIQLHLANLATTYAQLLAQSSPEYGEIALDTRVVFARRLLNGVVDACKARSATSLIRLFDHDQQYETVRDWVKEGTFPSNPLIELECLGQTLTPVLPNLESGKFFWQSMAEIRVSLLSSTAHKAKSISPDAAKSHDRTIDQPDLTASKLRESEEKFRNIVESTPLGMHFYELHPDGRLVLTGANPAADRLLGVDNSQFIGKTIEEAFPPLSQTEIPDQYRQVAAAGQPWQTEQVTYDHNQIQGAFEVRAFQTSPGKMVASFLDVTERKRSEKALEESLSLLQAVLDNMPVGVFVVEAPSGRPIIVNERAKQMLGQGISPTATKNELADLYEAYLYGSDELYPSEQMPLVRGMFGESATINDMEIRRSDGVRQLLQVFGAPIRDADNNITASVAIFQDITQGKELENSLTKRAIELETVAEVSAAAATVPEVDKLLQQVADLTKERFGLYHAHVYLLNEAEDTLELAAGAGDVGRQMVAQGWHIPLDREHSLVARAARSQRGVFVNDVRQDPDFLPNPLLPDTRAELAVPMVVGDHTVGVIDVQADLVDYFSDEDVRIQTILASQVGTSLKNIHSLDKTQRLAQREQTIREITNKMRTASDLGRLLDIATQELSRHLSATHTKLELGIDPKQPVNGNGPAKQVVVQKNEKSN